MTLLHNYVLIRKLNFLPNWFLSLVKNKHISSKHHFLHLPEPGSLLTMSLSSDSWTMQRSFRLCPTGLQR